MRTNRLAIGVALLATNSGTVVHATGGGGKIVLAPANVPPSCTALCQFSVAQTGSCDAQNRGKDEFLLCVCSAANSNMRLWM